MSDGGFHGYLNPLLFTAAEFPRGDGSNNVTPQDVLDYLCKPEVDSEPAALVARYGEVSKTGKQLFVAPAEQTLLERLVWPLKNARACHMVGNYLGTIALCGMVAEMAALLIFEMSDTNLNGSLITKEQEEQIFGRAFEKLGQSRRVKVLKGHSLITVETFATFGEIRVIRNKYLHYWSEGHEGLQADSAKVCDAALSLVIDVIGNRISDGKIQLRPGLIRYLKRVGAIEESPEGVG